MQILPATEIISRQLLTRAGYKVIAITDARVQRGGVVYDGRFERQDGAALSSVIVNITRRSTGVFGVTIGDVANPETFLASLTHDGTFELVAAPSSAPR